MKESGDERRNNLKVNVGAERGREHEEENMRWFGAYTEDGLGWVRIFGFGLKWKDTRRHPLLFSERDGSQRCITIGHWRISLLGGCLRTFQYP